MTPGREAPAKRLQSEEGSRLESLLERALIERDYYHHEVVDPFRVVELEDRVQEIARVLRPEDPEHAIREANQRVAFDRIGPRLVERARLPRDPDYLEEAGRVRARYLETEIRQLARQASPESPPAAIRSAYQELKSWSEGHAPRRFEGRAPLELPDDLKRNLRGVSSRVSIQLLGPQPAQHRKVERLVADIRRLDQLRDEARMIAESMSRTLMGGDEYELRQALEKVRSVQEIFAEQAVYIYRKPDVALARADQLAKQSGEWEVANALESRPEVLGELLGRKPLGRENLERAQARLSAKHAAHVLRDEDGKRSLLLSELSFLRIDRERLAANRQVVEAFPSREQLLFKLGREMERLNLGELLPTWSSEACQIVQKVRAAELTFLEPMREAAKIATSANGLDQAVQGNSVAPLFAKAPKHIVRRLSPPQLKVGLAALSVARRVARAASSRVVSAPG